MNFPDDFKVGLEVKGVTGIQGTISGVDSFAFWVLFDGDAHSMRYPGQDNAHRFTLIKPPGSPRTEPDTR